MPRSSSRMSLSLLVLLAAALGGCSADATSDSPGDDDSPGAAASIDTETDAPTGNLTTQAGGGTVQVAGEYSATLTFDSVWCQLIDDQLSIFYAPYGPQSGGTFVTPADGVFLEGFPTRLVIGFDADGTSGIAGTGPTVNGTTLDLDGIAITVSAPGEVNRSATATGSLTCTHIERV